MSVDWAIRQALDPHELVPMLRRLAAVAGPDSDDFYFAHRHLAELGVELQPWHAALSARKVLARNPNDDRLWGVLGLAYTLLTHYRAAIAAYRRAVALSPTNPWYAHNLGHLIDVALDRPADALSLLAIAHKGEPREVEITASYAHALGRAGRVEEARKLLRKALKGGGTAEHKALLEWLEQGGSGGAQAKDSAPRRRRARSRSSDQATSRKRSR